MCHGWTSAIKHPSLAASSCTHQSRKNLTENHLLQPGRPQRTSREPGQGEQRWQGWPSWW